MFEKKLSSSSAKHCILQCNDATHFFNFPKEDIFRNLWLYKLDMDQSDYTGFVCDKHFSKDMLCSTGMELMELAVPDRNLPRTLRGHAEICDHLKHNTHVQTAAPINSTPSKNILRTKSSTPNNSGSKQGFKRDISVPLEKDWINDSSNLLIDYQLRFQGAMCDVIELPEFIVVFTVVKPKEPKERLQNSSYNRKRICNANLLQSTVRQDTSTRMSFVDKFSKSNTVPFVHSGSKQDIEYVYYTSDADKPRREREVQANSFNDVSETATQCDIDFDIHLEQNSLQLRSSETDLCNKEADMHECHKCGEIVPNYASKLRHKVKHEKMNSLCAYCGTFFTDTFKLKTHEKEVHTENAFEIKKATRCPKWRCKKAFHSMKQLYKHINEHVQNAEIKCNKCLRFFSSSHRLHQHMRRDRTCKQLRRPRNRRWSK